MKRIKLRLQRKQSKPSYWRKQLVIDVVEWSCPYCERIGMIEQWPGSWYDSSPWDTAVTAATQHIVAKHMPPTRLILN